MEETLVLNLDKVRQGIAVDEGELLHKPQMALLLDKIRQIMKSVEDFRRQFNDDQRQSSISHRRHHDAILLSGARGTGKTTFLLSALHTLQNKKLDDNYSFCVFEPVDPTLFGYNEHILFTLLSMITKAVWRCRNHSETSRYCRSGVSDAWEAWEKQLKDLAKGLQTVGEQREDIGSEPSPQKNVWEDAEYLLEEGIDKARSSYELEYKLHSFINTSLRLLDKDAFVLGLDDVDTRPGIGWHVLEVLRRYLTTPQIIVIVSGNMELFQKLVERRQLKTFGLDFSSDKNVLQKFSPQVTELTNQYLLKILRTPLRIELLPFYEALERAFLTRKKQKDASDDIADNIRDKQKDTSDDIAIDDYCFIEFDGKRKALTELLKIFYKALSCGNPNLQAVFRKALLDNSARTVLQIIEQLIELQGSSQSSDNMMLSLRVAEILRIVFFDYLVASGIAQPQEYFERLREGVGIEEITRLLLADKLPGDATLLPVHRDFNANNSLLALSGMLIAAASNIDMLFIYFFKVCLVLHVLDGRNESDDFVNAILGETSLSTLAFRCSSLLYGDARRPSWRAPGILAVYGSSAEKNIPQRAQSIYGDNIKAFLRHNSPLNLTWPKALKYFISKVCTDTPAPQMRGYVITTPESLQNDILSWHREIIPHGFYEIIYPEGNYRFFSIWGLLGLMAEMLICKTSEDIFDILFRKARIITLQRDTPSVYRVFFDRKTSSNDEDLDDITADKKFEEQVKTKEHIDFINKIVAWKNYHITHSALRECPAYILLYQFSPKDTGQSKVK